MNAHAAPRQAAMYAMGFALTPANPEMQPFKVDARATYADFFPMFDVPFEYGGSWAAADDDARAPVVVITHELNEKVFGGANSVGTTLNLDNDDYRVIGVLDHWDPMPRFYDLTNDELRQDRARVPAVHPRHRAARAFLGQHQLRRVVPRAAGRGCCVPNCVWIQFWAELPTPDGRRTTIGRFLNNYAAEQQRMRPLPLAAHTQLRNVREWLTYEHVVSDETRILVLVSFSFLLVCLLNAMGLMLAKIMGRAADIGVRRALGASRRRDIRPVPDRGRGGAASPAESSGCC